MVCLRGRDGTSLSRAGGDHSRLRHEPGLQAPLACETVAVSGARRALNHGPVVSHPKNVGHGHTRVAWLHHLPGPSSSAQNLRGHTKRAVRHRIERSLHPRPGPLLCSRDRCPRRVLPSSRSVDSLAPGDSPSESLAFDRARPGDRSSPPLPPFGDFFPDEPPNSGYDSESRSGQRLTAAQLAVDLAANRQIRNAGRHSRPEYLVCLPFGLRRSIFCLSTQTLAPRILIPPPLDKPQRICASRKHSCAHCGRRCPWARLSAAKLQGPEL